MSVQIAVYCAVVVLVLFALQTIQRLYFDPLSQLPGPKLWAALRWPYIISLWRGKLVYEVFDLHQKYGDVVRVAPNEVSFASRQAWVDIFHRRPGHQPFSRNMVWYGEVPGRAESIVSASSDQDHERHRGMIAHCFSDQALREEEPLIQSYVDKMIRKLLEKIDASGEKSVLVNMADWYMFALFDIIGDLCFGNTFDCLETSEYHPWILEMSSYFKYGALFSTVRMYDWLARIVIFCMPAKMVAAQERNHQWAVQRVHARLNTGVARDDFIERLLPYLHADAKGKHQMSMSELESNFYVLPTAGSGTCGTVLSGITSYLIKDSTIMAKMYAELCAHFSTPASMTFDSLAKLPYLNAVISEGLRLAPPVGGALAHVVPAGGDTACGFWLPGGTQVGLHQWSLNRLPSKFHNAASFVPERWLPETLNDLSSPYYHDDREAVQSFSAGIWQCLGKNMGLAELRVILSKVIWNFEMTPGLKQVKWGEQKQYVLIEVGDVEVTLCRRTQ